MTVADRSGDRFPTEFPAEFRAELAAAQRYERGLLVKAVICLLFVAAVGVLREWFLR